MNIVVTDGFTLNGGDLDWDELRNLGSLTVYDRTPNGLVVDRCREADVVLTNKTAFSREVMAALPALKCISVLATGYNVIDVEAAAEKGIVVCNVPGYGTASVAQHVFALLLELTNAVGLHSRSVQDGQWHRSADWAYTLQPVMELQGKTIGIIGYGHIGQQVARIADAFGMKVLFFTPRKISEGIGRQTTLEEVFSESDVVTLHCPLTQQNKGLVNLSLLSQMKKTAFLLNTARGTLVVEEDLAQALNSGMIAGAALDVLSEEPPTDHQLILTQAKNCIITPHNAWMSKEARSRIMQATIRNIEAWQNGHPINRVS